MRRQTDCAQQNSVEEAADPAEEWIVRPDGERATAFHVDTGAGVGEFTGAAVKPQTSKLCT
jgi:hypothetical protein